jgi:hypothetical protein
MSGGASPHMPGSEGTPTPAPAQSSSLKMGRYDVVHAQVEKQRDVAPATPQSGYLKLGRYDVVDDHVKKQRDAVPEVNSDAIGREPLRNDAASKPTQWDAENHEYDSNSNEDLDLPVVIDFSDDEESKRGYMDNYEDYAAGNDSYEWMMNVQFSRNRDITYLGWDWKDPQVCRLNNFYPCVERGDEPGAVSNEVLAVSPGPASTPEQTSMNTSTGLAINAPAAPSRDARSKLSATSPAPASILGQNSANTLTGRAINTTAVQSRAVSSEVPATSRALAPAPGQTSANTSTSRAINTPAAPLHDVPSGVPTIPANGATGPGGESAHQRLAREQRAAWDQKSEQRKQKYGDDYDDDDAPDQSSLNQSASRATNTPAGRSRRTASEGPAYRTYGPKYASEGNLMDGVEDTGDGGANSQGFEGFDDAGSDGEGEGQSDPMDEDDEDDYMSDGEPATTPARVISDIDEAFDTINGVPTGPKKGHHAAGGSNKRTGTRGAIQKGAGSNAATSRRPTRGRPSQNPRWQSEGTGFHGAYQRQQQASADRSAYSGNASSRGTNQTRRGGRGRSQATRGGVHSSTGNFYTNDRAQADQKRLGKAKRNTRGGR